MMPTDWLKTLYVEFGVKYPITSYFVVGTLGAALFIGVWWLVGKQYRSNADLKKKGSASQPIVSAETGQVLILVADFSGPDPEKYRVTETLLFNVEKATKEHEEVRIEALGETITAKQGTAVAREKGAAYNASIVLWGWYGKTSQRAQMTTRVEVLQAGRDWPSLHPDDDSVVVDVSQLENFEIQTEISKNMSYLVLVVSGLARYQVLDFGAADRRFSDALDLVEESKEVLGVGAIYFLRGNSRLFTEHPSSAIADYNQAIELGNDLGVFYSNRGAAEAMIGQTEKALVDFQKAINKNPADFAAYNNRANISYKANPDQAIEDSTRAINLVPNYAEAFVTRANAYRVKGEHDRAISDFSKAIELRPNQSLTYMRRGNTYLDLGDLESAMSDQNRAIKLNPRSFLGYLGRANVHSKKGDIDRALADLNTALKLNPQSAPAYNDRGNAYSREGEDDRALDDYKKALAIDAKLTGVHYNRGNLYSERGDFESAIADYTEEIELEATETFQKAYSARGRALCETGRFEAGIADLTKAINLNSADHKAFGNRGAAYSAINDLPRALRDLNQAINIDSNYAPAYNNRAHVHIQQGQVDKAFADVNRAIATDPEYAVAYQTRGEAFKLRGETRKASADFEKVLQLSNDPRRREEVRKLLREITHD